MAIDQPIWHQILSLISNLSFLINVYSTLAWSRPHSLCSVLRPTLSPHTASTLAPVRQLFRTGTEMVITTWSLRRMETETPSYTLWCLQVPSTSWMAQTGLLCSTLPTMGVIISTGILAAPIRTYPRKTLITSMSSSAARSTKSTKSTTEAAMKPRRHSLQQRPQQCTTLRYESHKTLRQTHYRQISTEWTGI